MLEGAATREDVLWVASVLTRDLTKNAETIALSHSRPDGLEVWTKAIWKSFDSLRAELGSDWQLFPVAPSKGPGRAAGEFLTDYQLFDKEGPRIACESEFAFGAIESDFEKLCCVKSDIKIFVFEHELGNSLPESVQELAKKYLLNFRHVYKNEHYLFIQLDHSESGTFLWSAEQDGPIRNKEEIAFTLISKTSSRPDNIQSESG